MTPAVCPKPRTETMFMPSIRGYFDLNEVVGTQLKLCKCAFRVEIPCNLGLNCGIKTSPFFQPTYFTLPATEQTFTQQLTVLCDLTVGLPDHAPIQFSSMMWCHQTQFCLLSCIWEWYRHVFTPAFTPNISNSMPHHVHSFLWPQQDLFLPHSSHTFPLS